MMHEDVLKEKVRQLEVVIGPGAARALWYKYLAAKTPEKREAFRQKITLLAELMLNLYKDKLLLPPPEKEKLEGEIPVGKVIYNDKELYDFKIKRQDLIRHVGIFGKTGSGKTNVAFHLIKSLLDQGIPFMVFDWKRNFRDLLKLPEFKGKIKFYTVGREVLPFHFNPKEGPRNCDKEAYQKKFCEVIEWAYFLGFGVHDIMMEAYDKGNFEQMREWLLKQNIVLELDGLSESDKCFVIGSILNWIQEFRRAQPEREILKHCLMVEEAHHLFRRKPDTKPEDITDVIFREIREYGESIIILDQHPHKTSVQALGNTNTRIALQTELEKDRRALAGCMMIRKGQEEWLGKLQIGFGIAKTGDVEDPFMIKITKFEIEKGVITDYALKREFKKCKRKNSDTPPTPRAETKTI